MSDIHTILDDLTPVQHSSISTGWAALDAMTGIGGYPERRLTHIHGPAYKTLELTRGWGATVAVTTLDALVSVQVIKRQPARLVVDASALQSPEQWRGFDHRRVQDKLPSTVLWLTSGASESIPKALKYSAYLRLLCESDQVCIVKNLASAERGYISWLRLVTPRQ